MNVSQTADFAFPIPLSLTDPTDEYYFYSIFGNPNHSIRANDSTQFSDQVESIFVANFSHATNTEA